MALQSRVSGIVFVGVWFAAAVFGISSLHKYSSTPAPSDPPRGNWPLASAIVPCSTKSTFVIFLHPHCPCSRASVAAMNEIMNTFPNSAEFHAVFVRPAGVNADWLQSDLYQACKGNDRLVTSIDDNGVEAVKFGAKASGQTYIYDANHQLAFSGGLTSGRGMEEKGEERKMVASALIKRQNSPLHSPTFGCALI